MASRVAWRCSQLPPLDELPLTYVTWAVTTSFLQSSSYLNTVTTLRTGVLVKRLGDCYPFLPSTNYPKDFLIAVLLLYSIRWLQRLSSHSLSANMKMPWRERLWLPMATPPIMSYWNIS